MWVNDRKKLKVSGNEELKNRYKKTTIHRVLSTQPRHWLENVIRIPDNNKNKVSTAKWEEKTEDEG